MKKKYLLIGLCFVAGLATKVQSVIPVFTNLIVLPGPERNNIGYAVPVNTSKGSPGHRFKTNPTSLHGFNYSGTLQDFAGTHENMAVNNSGYGAGRSGTLPLSLLLQTDASIGSIIDPAGGLICSKVITPRITIRNLGPDTLKTVEVGMLLDGSPLGLITTFNNLSLPTSSSSPVIVLSPDFAPAAGEHELKVFTRNPNGSTDPETTNDTLTVIFTIAPTLVLTYKESFESTVFPPANGSAVINENPGSVTWTRSIDAGNPGSASLTLNAFNYAEAGERDIYRTPGLNVGILDSAVLNFNVAYKEYEDASDSLLVVYSPDCGFTWLPTGYARGGPSLSSSAGTTTEEFIPRASEWRTERVVFKDFCSNDLQSIMIGFQSYNDFGNNIYIDGINIAGYLSTQRNIRLSSIDEPQLALCVNSLTPAVSFSNEGIDTIHSLKINYQVDGGAVSTFNWTGSLAKCKTDSAILSTAVSTTGTHILTVYTSEPNGLFDVVSANDTLRKAFTIYNEIPVLPPVVEDFETPGIPQNNWGIQNPDGLKTWERSAIAAKTGIASLWINNPAADNANSAVDNFISPIIDNSVPVDSMFVSWDHAYKAGARYPGSTVLPLDTLEVLVSGDCGASFTSIWKKWGEDLQTVNDPNYSDSTAFVPNRPEQWKSNKVYLTPFTGTGNFQVYFSSKSNKQNNIWLDNVNITSKTLPQRLKNQGYLIYPNPFGNSFMVHHILPPVELQALQVYNSTGQLVWDKRYNGDATTEVSVGPGNLAKGVYVIKMIYSNKTVVEKIVKN